MLQHALFSGRNLRDAGLRRVTSNTDDGWRGAFYAAADSWFVGVPTGEQFTGEVIRFAAKRAGIGEPHHANAWSSAIRAKVNEWSDCRAVAVVGATNCIDPKAHRRLTRLYKKVSA